MATDKKMLTRAGYVVATLVLGAGAYVLGTNVVKNKVNPQPAPAATPSAQASQNFKVFNDTNGGIKLSIPANWKLLEDNSSKPLSENKEAPENRRLVAGPSTKEPLFFARVIPLPEEIVIPKDITTQDLQIIQGQLDKLIICTPAEQKAGVCDDVRIADERATNVKGKLAWRYLYNFKDQATGRDGSHVHYFIFDGAKVDVLVFEAVPADRLKDLAPTFDKILNSFESQTRTGPIPTPATLTSPSPAN